MLHLMLGLLALTAAFDATLHSSYPAAPTSAAATLISTSPSVTTAPARILAVLRNSN
jgi:hypothetical protein